MMNFISLGHISLALLFSYFSGLATGTPDLRKRNFSLQANPVKIHHQTSLEFSDVTNSLIPFDGNILEKSVDLTPYRALLASISVVIVSELGDKTWFIAAIMAMRHSRLIVYCGAMAALILMTLLSAALGWFTQVMPRILTYSISTALFALFGMKMLYDGYRMSPADGQESYAEAKTEIQKKDLLADPSKVSDIESGRTAVSNQNLPRALLCLISKLFLESFMLTFLAEWGDRSQLTTIMLAARENIYGVVVGTILGHAFCTGIAVIGGRLIATQISVRTVTLIGGVVFIFFAFSSFFTNPELE